MNDRLGEIRYNNFNEKMMIIKYNNSKNIVVEFQDENKAKLSCEYSQFIDGRIKNPYNKIVYNVGYYGVGVYTYKNNTLIYSYWNNMLKRCYDKNIKQKHPTYINCTVCDEWHNFQNFAKWYEDNYYEIGEEQMTLDKDILHKGNKIYSPENCVFVPQSINKLFTKNDALRGELPIGVNYKKQNNKYQANISKTKQVFLGYYDTIEEAFNTYKKAKENYIKQVAEKYKVKIPKRLYDAMNKYEVEVTD